MGCGGSTFEEKLRGLCGERRRAMAAGSRGGGLTSPGLQAVVVALRGKRREAGHDSGVLGSEWSKEAHGRELGAFYSRRRWFGLSPARGSPEVVSTPGISSSIAAR